MAITPTQKQEIVTYVQGLEESFHKMQVVDDVNFNSEANFAIQALLNNEYLMQVALNNKASLRAAVNNIAAIGLSLNPVKKEAYLVPRKLNGGISVCLDISYMGLVQAAIKTGSIEWVKAEIVRLNDSFEYKGVNVMPEHNFNPFKLKDRGEIVGVYCVAKLHNGDYLVDTMDIESLENIRDKSESWKNERARKYSPWYTFPEEMMKKTVIKRAAKLFPKRDTSLLLENAINVLHETNGIDFSSEQRKVSSELVEAAQALIPPPEPQEVGPDYEIHYGGYRGKKLNEIPMIDIEDYRDKLLKRNNPKTWELEMINVLTKYLDMGGHDETIEMDFGEDE